MKVFVPNIPNKSWLNVIKKEIQKLGTPKIRAYWDEQEYAYFCLEGSHRIAACYDLDIESEYIHMDKNDLLYDHDLVDREGESLPDPVRVEEVLKTLYNEDRQLNYIEF